MKYYTVSTFWDNRVADKVTLLSRVMLKVSIDGKPFAIAIRKFRCLYADYLRSFSDKALSPAQKEVRKVIFDEVSKAESILERLGGGASKDAFLKLYKSSVAISVDEKTDAYRIFDERIADLREQGKKGNRSAFGSATSIHNAKHSFKMFKEKFYLEDVTAKWIEDYRKEMKKLGRSVSTTSMYLRVLRSIIKQCITDKVVLIDKNPFEGISLKGSIKSSKDIIYPNEMKKLWEYQPVGVIETRAKDFFFFCYLSSGMNFKDVVGLKNKNLKADRFVFIRSKTSTTTAAEREVTVYLCDEVKAIIEKYRSKSNKPDAFLFELFNIKDPAQHHKTFIRIKRVINKSLTKISAKLGINRVYLGIARHSFATAHKIKGTPVAYISEAMGHTSTQTTEHYLKQLPNELGKRMNSDLLNFG